MYYIIDEKLLHETGRNFYLTGYNEKKKIAIYKPHVEEALAFEDLYEASELRWKIPETIRGILHAE